MAINLKNPKMKGKKAIFFTLIAVLTVSLFILAYKSSSTESTLNRIPIVEQRIQSANNLMDNLHNVYINEILEVSLKNAFFGYHDYLIAEESFDYNEEQMKVHVIKLMENGKIDAGPIYNDYTISNLMNNISYNLNKSMRMDLDYEYANIRIFQDELTGPWFVGVEADFNLSLNATAATWNSSKTYSTFVYIKNLYDPYHSLNTLNATGDYVKRPILPSTQTSWNGSSFANFVNGGEYYSSNYTPSFFGRLVNSSDGSNCCGIETYITQDSLYHRVDGTLGNYWNVSFSDICYFNKDETSDFCGGLKMKIEDISSDYTDTTNMSYPFTIATRQVGYYNISADYYKFRTI